jgi:hypothetical protein
LSGKIYLCQTPLVSHPGGVPTIYVKVHKRGGHLCAAACDEDLLGQTLEEDPYYVTIKEDFFRGDLVEDDDPSTSALFQRSTSLNLFGEAAVALGIEAGCIDPDNVVRIRGVPHAQMFEV